ncbi:hypothetical protein Dsin_015441 [Dipteronia sinensis]|uniref:E2 ubiquitin-conjugating enzyme n=1 Tax=Dipteronia sinensis TaxID=43782 RepID=A0AAE0ABA2_9ROSI|nr:hypothetical protein Dsin_015441 [Dipteronia sinensis]
MAQAARLNLRMQKELKLLLTDPPPGASLPLLSVDSDISSLSTIHAQIEGPEESVYAKGIFDIKIQIPERYPFQPPSVTFGTPIYHPNIDNGGRICLDILNLPPKGAWQPSLNISTVLTSIGLLLTEPNPDDGLMREASREYKYNRQAFDQKARSMTEKYAKGGAGGIGCSTQDVQTNLNPIMTEFRGSEKSRLEVSESISSQKKPWGISRKLSLESSSSSQNKDGDGEVSEVHNDHLFLSDQMEAKGKRKGVNIIPDECNLSRDKLHGSRRKLSLESSCQIQKRDGHDKENLVSNHSAFCDPQTASVASSASSVLQSNKCSQQILHPPQTTELVAGSTNMSTKQSCQFSEKQSLKSLSSASHGASSMTLSKQQPHKDFINNDRMGNCSTVAECRKISSVGKKLSLGYKGSTQVKKTENKENVAPVSRVDKLPLSTPQGSSTKRGIGGILSLGPLTQLQGSNDNSSQLFVHAENLSTTSSMTLTKEKQSNQEQAAKVDGKSEVQRVEDLPILEAVIVLDSEDSEDEKDGGLRSKLLARKRLGKWRVKA